MVAELDDFVLNRRTITGAGPDYFPAVQGGFIKILPDDLMSQLIGISVPANNLIFQRPPGPVEKGKGGSSPG